MVKYKRLCRNEGELWSKKEKGYKYLTIPQTRKECTCDMNDTATYEHNLLLKQLKNRMMSDE